MMPGHIDSFPRRIILVLVWKTSLTFPWPGHHRPQTPQGARGFFNREVYFEESYCSRQRRAVRCAFLLARFFDSSCPPLLQERRAIFISTLNYHASFGNGIPRAKFCAAHERTWAKYSSNSPVESSVVVFLISSSFLPMVMNLRGRNSSLNQ